MATLAVAEAPQPAPAPAKAAERRYYFVIRLLSGMRLPPGRSPRHGFAPGEYFFGKGADCWIRPLNATVGEREMLLAVGEERVEARQVPGPVGLGVVRVNGKNAGAGTVLARGDRLEVGPMIYEVEGWVER